MKMFSFAMSKNLKVIVIFLSLYFVLNIFLSLFSTSINIIIDKLLLNNFIKFLILFIFQWILIFFILFISVRLSRLDFYELLLDLKKNFFNKIRFKDIFLWGIIFYFVSLIVLSIIFGIVRYIEVKIWINIPWFWTWASDQKVANFLLNLSLNNIWEYLIIFAVVAVFWPLFEEIVFRFFVTEKLLQVFWPVLWIFFSAFIFALVHLEWQVFFNIFFLSLFLSYLWYKKKSLLINFMYHFLFNGINLLILWFVL